MDVHLSSGLFYSLLTVGMISGFWGGWMFYPIKMKLGPDWERRFTIAAILMLLQDILIAFFFLQGVTEIAIFILIIFLTPSIGFLSSQRWN